MASSLVSKRPPTQPGRLKSPAFPLCLRSQAKEEKTHFEQRFGYLNDPPLWWDLCKSFDYLTLSKIILTLT